MAGDAGTEAERQRARRYRIGADECRTQAAETKDLILMTRPGLIQFAHLCEILADSIEARFGEDTTDDSH